jgi:SAM-dependent methyltransferase
MATPKISDVGPLNVPYSPTTTPRRDTPDFDSLARIYRWMEYLSFGPMLERCRFHFLGRCSQARRALVLGDGDGRFTARLLATNQNVEIDAVDSSAAMLTELRRRGLHASVDAENRLRTIHADLRKVTPDNHPPDPKYDLVVSHFFLDCLTDNEVAGVVERIIPHLTSDAAWLISEFSIPEKGWRRATATQIVRFLYFAFDKMTHLRVHKIPDYGHILGRCGFRCRQRTRMLCGLLVTEVWRLENRSQ